MMQPRAVLVGILVWSSQVSIPALADGLPDSGVADFFYDFVTGTMRLETDGNALVSMQIEGPPAETVDRFAGVDAETQTEWLSMYFNGRQQWADISVTGVDGIFQIATYDDGLDAAAFASVTYGTLSGETVTTQVTVNLPEFFADFDKDNDVDGDDFLIWQINFGTPAGASANDGDADGNDAVDGNDFLIWQQEFGGGGGEGALAAVPEPLAADLVIFAALPMLSRRRKAGTVRPAQEPPR